jgi:predicted small lipoprotein YifL
MKRIAVFLVVVSIAACGKSEAPPAETKTKAQKDSAIANSGLPGTKGVGMAMNAADSAKARQAALDSAGKP